MKRLKNANLKIHRLIYLISVMITIALGLASRKYGTRLPSFLANHAGDALWAMMVYFGFRFIFVKNSRILAIVLSFIFSFSIELSQLYQADWLNAVRNTPLGALVLGKGFLFIDLVRYLLGIILGLVIDYVAVDFLKHKKG